MYHGERFNSISHLAGTMLSITGLIALIAVATQAGDPWKIVSFSIYGAMLVLLYGTSTLYHSIRHARVKAVMQKFDHAAIYLLIAGTYTPFTLVTLRGAWGWTLFGINWGLALFGIVQEMTIGRKSKNRPLSLIIYVVMGWLILVAMKPLAAALPAAGLWWLAAGGLTYSLGIYFFIKDEKIRHGHGIWHLFVLGGSACQYVAVLQYV